MILFYFNNVYIQNYLIITYILCIYAFLYFSYIWQKKYFTHSPHVNHPWLIALIGIEMFNFILLEFLFCTVWNEVGILDCDFPLINTRLDETKKLWEQSTLFLQITVLFVFYNGSFVSPFSLKAYPTRLCLPTKRDIFASKWSVTQFHLVSPLYSVFSVDFTILQPKRRKLFSVSKSYYAVTHSCFRT